ncbi:class I SAM-dependent methyltransferase, partial [Candidatus Woesearchaeota archaeon]|nr:class I SAM-dependent methyltransferase [Candidatus Woesearchaeota archaeon]
MKEYDNLWKEQENKESGLRTLIDEHELKLIPGKKVLDLGCGDGFTLAFLAKQGFTVTGIDYSEVGIENAKKRLSEESDARILQGDIYEPLPFEDEEFDAVIAYQVINHNYIEKIRLLLKELNRILKPGGLFSVKVADSSTYAFTYLDGLAYDEFGSVLKPVADRTFLPIAGWEKGVIHYEFNKEILQKEVGEAGFELLDMRIIVCHVLAN